jgi:hypothetical protein
LSENFLLSDTLNKNVILAIQDDLLIADAVIKNLSVLKSEIIYLTDSLVRKDAGLNLADTVHLSDATNKSVRFILEDALVIADQISNHFKTTASDNFVISDNLLNKVITIAKNDTVVLSDDILRRNIIAVIEDIVILSDDIAKSMLRYFHDVMEITDQARVTILRILIWREMLNASDKIRQLYVEAITKELTVNAKVREIVCTPVHRQKEESMLYLSPKQSYEEYYVVFNFARVVTPTTSVMIASVIVYDASDTVVTSTLTDESKLSITGTKVYVWVRGGSEQTYKITCKIEMSNGEKFEQDAELEVTEI